LFFARAIATSTAPAEVTTDRAPVYSRVIDEFAPKARHVLDRYATDENVNSGA
jgi:transposase-like protein